MSKEINFYSIAKELEFDLEDLIRITDLFISNAKESMKKFEEALENNNLQLIYESCHAIKGSASNILLEEITKTANHIAKSAHSQTHIDYQQGYKDLQKQLNFVEVKLKELPSS